MDLRSPPGTEPLSRTHYTTILTQEIYCQNYSLDVGIKGSYLTFLFIGKDIQKLIQVKVLRIALLSPLLKRTHSSVRSSHTWPTGELTGTFCQVTVAHTVVTLNPSPSLAPSLFSMSLALRGKPLSHLQQLFLHAMTTSASDKHTCSASYPTIYCWTAQNGRRLRPILTLMSANMHLKTMYCPKPAAAVRARHLICLVIQHISWLF